MKKFLSLVLALIMTMSLVTVSAGAKDFTDDDKITYEEAVAVMSEVKVLDGYADGSFNPQGGLTRGAAAKIICNLILGPTTAAELNADTAPFKDVPVDHTFAGYIAYCAKEGIISGYADGAFRPAAPLTGYAFMKMLLGALGYDAGVEGYTGANWSINVAKRALAIGLNAGLVGDFSGIKAVNREEAALYAFNTLQADLVEYDSKTSVTVGGAEVVIAGSEAKAQRWNNSATRINNIKDDEYIQFAEQYFNKLTKKNDTDVFGRPAHTWVYGKETIGTYVDYTLKVEEYTDSVTGKELYDLLGKSVVNDYEISVYMDGDAQDLDVVNEITKANKTSFSPSGLGALTEVFVDKDNEEVIVTVINTYLAIATADYNTKSESASFVIYGATGNSTAGIAKTQTKNEDKTGAVKVENDDVQVDFIKKDDVVLVTVANKAIQSVEIAEVVEDVTIDSFKLGSKINCGGDTYNYAETAEYDFEVLDAYSDNNMKEKTYNVYLDTYGNLIGLEYVTVADNYVFITGMDTASTTNLANGTYKTKGIFLDGTVAVFEAKISSDATNALKPGTQVNLWCTYTVSKDVYTLTDVKTGWETGDKVAQGTVDDAGVDGEGIPIDYKHPSLNVTEGNKNYVYGNNDSVYLTAKLAKVGTDTVIDGVANVTTGIKNTSIVTYVEGADAVKGGAELKKAVYVLFKSNGYIIGAVVVGEDAAVSKNLVYVNSSNVSLEGYSSSTDEWTWTREVICGGEKVELTEVGSTLTWLGKTQMTQYAWYIVSYDAKGNVTNTEKVIADKTNIEYVADYASGAIQAGINTGKDTVLYEQDFTNVAKTALPTLIEQTLYLDDTNTNGFYIAEDAKVVFIQMNDGKTTTSYEEGPAAIEAAIEVLNSDDAGYTYELTAVIERGAAQVVIIRDTVKSAAGSGDKTTTGGSSSIKITVANGAITYENWAAEDGVDVLATAIVNTLKSKGYTDVIVSVTAGNIDGVMATRNNITYTFGAPSEAAVG